MELLVVSAIFAALGTIFIAVDSLERSFGGWITGLFFGGIYAGVKNMYLSWPTLSPHPQDAVLLIGGSMAGVGLGLMAVQLHALFIRK